MRITDQSHFQKEIFGTIYSNQLQQPLVSWPAKEPDEPKNQQVKNYILSLYSSKSNLSKRYKIHPKWSQGLCAAVNLVVQPEIA